MLGTVRNVDGTNEPFTIAGLSDGSTDIVHRECNENYQIPMAVDCQYGAGYLGITDCCKFLFNPTTGVATVNCIDTTTTCVDVNDNSDICTNQPILSQGFDADGCLDNKVEKTAAVYNANCYVCNDPTTGDPIRKPVLFIPTVKADEYLCLPKDYPIKYVDALPTSPDIEDYIYAYEETVNAAADTLGAIRDKYYDKPNTKSIVLDDKTVATIAADYSEWTDTDGTTHASTRDTTFTTAEVKVEKMKAGDASAQYLYEIGSGESGEGSLSLSPLPTSNFAEVALVDKYGKVAYCDTGVCVYKDDTCTVIKHGIDRITLTNDGYNEYANCDGTAKCVCDALCCHRIEFEDSCKGTVTLQTKCIFSVNNRIYPPNNACVTTNATNIDTDGFRTYQVNNYNCVLSRLRSGLSYENGTHCTCDFQACSCISCLYNDLKFNTSIAYGKFGLSYSGGNTIDHSSNCLGIGNGQHSYTESTCPTVIIGYNCYYLSNTYTDQVLGTNNRVKTIKAADGNTYKQLELTNHLYTNTRDTSENYECIEMDYKCVCNGNTCFEGKTKYCTTNGKWYVCCDSTKGYKCLLNEDEVSATGGRNYITGTFADFCEAVQCIETSNGFNKDTPVVANFSPAISFTDSYGCVHTTNELVGTFSPEESGTGHFVGIYYDTALCKPIDFSFWYSRYGMSNEWTTSNNVIASNADAWVSLVGTGDTCLTCYSSSNCIAMDPYTGVLRSCGGYTSDGSIRIRAESANELNIIPTSGATVWINYRGGASNVYIGDGNDSTSGYGNLAAANVTANLHGRISMADNLCATDCSFMPYSGACAPYGLKPSDWAHALTFSHGNFDTYYGTTVSVPFWDCDRFQWRTRNSGTLYDIHTLLDDRGGQTVANGMYLGNGQNYIGYKATSFNGFTIQDNQTCALYLEGRESTEGDSGGVAITNDGVTAFGAGDTDGVFRVVNEDNVAAGAVFKVMRDGSTYTCGQVTSRRGLTDPNTTVASFAGATQINGYGYVSGPWVGRKHSNAVNGAWWGYAELGLYDAENGIYRDGLCVDCTGVAYAPKFCSNTFAGTYGNISFSNNNRVEITPESDGVVLYGPNQASFVYVTANAIHLNSGPGNVYSHCPFIAQAGIQFCSGAGCAVGHLYSTTDDDVRLDSTCCIILTTAQTADVAFSTYDFCVGARHTTWLESPETIVCGTLCWEDENFCGRYQKEPHVYKDNELNTANWGISELASVSNRIILVDAKLGAVPTPISTQNCGIVTVDGSNTYWTGEVIPIGDGCTAIFNGSIRTNQLTIYGGIQLSCISGMALYGFGIS